MRLGILFNKAVEYGFFLLFFATPLLFNPSRTIPSFELFEWNKMMFVYGMTTVIVGAWIGRMITARKIYFKRTPFDLPLLLFLLSQSLATLFSIDRHVSIFGYYSRFHGGLLSTISYILLYYAFVANKEIINLKRLILFVLSSGTVVALYGIAEKFGIDAHMWVQDVRSRVFSTLGQPNWLAAYLATLLPISLVLVILTSKNKILNIHIKYQKTTTIVIRLLCLLFYVCLLFTRSRSGFLGFWAANGLFWLFIIWFNRIRVKHYLPQFLILNSLFLILNFFIKTPFSQYNRLATVEVFSRQPIVEETKPPIGDSVINVGITDSGKIRQIVWKGALNIAQDYPLFGTGPETFAFAYYKYRPAEHNLTSEWDFLYNRAHNEFLNIAATSGFFGLGTYLFLITFVFIWSIVKLIRAIRNTSTFDARYWSLVIGLLAAYLSIQITNFFGFSVVIVGLYFFLIPAFIERLALTYTPITVEAKAASSRKIVTTQMGLLIFLGLAVIFILITLGRFWKADSLYAKASSLGRLGNWQESYTQIAHATSLRPDEPVYHNERAEVTTSLAELALESEQATEAAKLARVAIEESTVALSISPQNVNFWKTRTKIFFLLSQIDPTFTQNALDTIRIAQELAPTDAKIAYNVAVILGRADKNQEAITTLLKTIELKPDYRDAYIALAIFYEEEKQVDKARDILELALKRINPDDAEIKEKLEKLK